MGGQGPVEVGVNHPRLQNTEPVGNPDIQDAVHSTQIQHNRVGYRYRAAGQTGACAAWNQRQAVFGRQGYNGRHLGGIGGPHGRGRTHAVIRGVRSIGDQVNQSRGDAVSSDDSGKIV